MFGDAARNGLEASCFAALKRFDRSGPVLPHRLAMIRSVVSRRNEL